MRLHLRGLTPHLKGMNDRQRDDKSRYYVVKSSAIEKKKERNKKCREDLLCRDNNIFNSTSAIHPIDNG